MARAILIAKSRNARFLKNEYKIGWFTKDDSGWLWTVWGSASNLENAIKYAKETIDKRGKGPIYVSETPLIKELIVQTEELNITTVNKDLGGVYD